VTKSLDFPLDQLKYEIITGIANQQG